VATPKPVLERGHHQLAGPAKWTYYYLYVIVDIYWSNSMSSIYRRVLPATPF